MATISKRGDTYRIRVSAGYDLSGRQIIKSTTWKPSSGMTENQIKKELNRQATLFEEQVKNGLYVKQDMRLAEFSDLWFSDYGKAHLKPTTYKRYSDCMQRINAALGHIRLSKLQPHHIISFYNNLSESGIRSDTKYAALPDLAKLMKQNKITQAVLAETADLSTSTVRQAVHGNNISASTADAICKALEIKKEKYFSVDQTKQNLAGATVLYHHHVLSSILTTAVQWQVIPSNPCSRVKPPEAPKHEAKYLDEEQAAQLLSALDTEPLRYRALFTLILFTGMRRGEALGLTWEDIDLKNGIVNINKSSLYLPERGIFENDTKTESSHRIIKIPETATELLRLHKLEQNKDRLKAGDQWQDSNKVFTTWNGAPLNPDTASSWFSKFIKRHDLPDITIHSLRHTNATLMIANGTDIKTVSKRLGHANVTTTGNIYTHAIRSADDRAAEALNELFTSKKA